MYIFFLEEGFTVANIFDHYHVKSCLYYLFFCLLFWSLYIIFPVGLLLLHSFNELYYNNS